MGSNDGSRERVTLESLTDEEAIFKAVRNKCIQSPLTIIPLALAGGVLLLAGAFSWGFLGVFASVVLGIVGAAAFVYNLWIRGEELTKRHIRFLMEKLKEDRRAALSEIAEMCTEIAFPEAAKEANELSEAYASYTEFLETRAGSKLGAAVGQRMGLAESARKAGAGHLRQAAEIHVALSGIDISMLRREVAWWERQRKEKDANQPVLESKIAAHTQQINRYDQLVAKREELIARSNGLEAALKSAYMADAGRTDLSLDAGTDNPATRLSRVVAAAEAAESDMREFLLDVREGTGITE